MVASEELMPKALELASNIASRAPLAVLACTQLLRRQRYEDLRMALLEERVQFAKVVCTNDAAEGIAAFAEKRKPKYTGT
jgi:enoyl-CoA hydratase/carnithine racemase